MQAKQILQNIENTLSRFPNEDEYHQAVLEVARDLAPWITKHPKYQNPALLEHIIIPDRVIHFKVAWRDEQHIMHHNMGYRVQCSNVLGPYKGGLRFSPNVNPSILKFLAFEQTFKNSLTGLPLGAGKGGSDFDPKEKSPQAIQNFCQAFADALSPYIGDKTDVPAGDIGVGGREINWMYGQLQRSRQHHMGVLTGKAAPYGGSLLRPEATGYGTVYFLKHMLKESKTFMEGRKVLISGAGNVALYAAEKCLALGAIVKTLSDSQGTLFFQEGLKEEQLGLIQRARFVEHKRLKDLSIHEARFFPKAKPWQFEGDIALPCATQNELDANDAKQLCKQGLIAVSEGANMPSTPEAQKIFFQHNILFGPGKAANAGGVAVSGLEMVQNNMGLSWSKEEVDQKLQSIMQHIHSLCHTFAQSEPPASGTINYAKGANIAGFVRVADSLMDLGYC